MLQQVDARSIALALIDIFSLQSDNYMHTMYIYETLF